MNSCREKITYLELETRHVSSPAIISRPRPSLLVHVVAVPCRDRVLRRPNGLALLVATIALVVAVREYSLK
jgi:hypothetical protein